MNKTLVILAAGIGSRFGTGIKQLEPIDDHGHLIIDYSVHDAISAGFDKVVFIIRHDIEEDFRARIGDRLEKLAKPLGVEVDYAFQDLSNVPFPVPKERKKPWGTAHAVMCCQGLIDSPFAVINADDYYGKDGFRLAAEFLDENEYKYGMIGYFLRNTLSDHGGVTRGICEIRNGVLTGIRETKNIRRGLGNDICDEDDNLLDPGSVVSMNFWCYPKIFVDEVSQYLSVFHDEMKEPLKDEFLLPDVADKMLKRGIPYEAMLSGDHWLGVTYQEDKLAVIEQFRQMLDNGMYRKDLYSDLKTIKPNVVMKQ